MDLDMQMSDPTFWDDPDKAKKISQEATLLKTEVEGHEELVRKADDLSEYLEMAMEDGDASFAEDIENSTTTCSRTLKSGKCGSSCPANTISATPSLPSTPVPAVRKPRTGRRCSSACIPAGLNAMVIN